LSYQRRATEEVKKESQQKHIIFVNSGSWVQFLLTPRKRGVTWKGLQGAWSMVGIFEKRSQAKEEKATETTLSKECTKYSNIEKFSV